MTDSYWTQKIKQSGPGVFGIAGLPGTGKTTIARIVANEWPNKVFVIDMDSEIRIRGVKLEKLTHQTSIADLKNSLLIIDEIDTWILEQPGERWNWVRGILKRARNRGMFVVWTSHSLCDVPFWAWRSVAVGLIFGRLSPRDKKSISMFGVRELDRVFAQEKYHFCWYKIAL